MNDLGRKVGVLLLLWDGLCKRYDQEPPEEGVGVLDLTGKLIGIKDQTGVIGQDERLFIRKSGFDWLPGSQQLENVGFDVAVQFRTEVQQLVGKHRSMIAAPAFSQRAE